MDQNPSSKSSSLSLGQASMLTVAPVKNQYNKFASRLFFEKFFNAKMLQLFENLLLFVNCLSTVTCRF